MFKTTPCLHNDKTEEKFFLKETFSEETFYKCSEKAAKYTGIDKGSAPKYSGIYKGKAAKTEIYKVEAAKYTGIYKGRQKNCQ